MHLRGQFGHLLSTNRQYRCLCKILPSSTLPVVYMISSDLQCPDPDINPLTQSSHSGTNTFVARTSVRFWPFLYLSSESILPQKASSLQSVTISFPVLRWSIALVPYIHLSFLILCWTNGKHWACLRLLEICFPNNVSQKLNYWGRDSLFQFLITSFCNPLTPSWFENVACKS